MHSGTSLRLICTLALPLVALLLPHTALASASDDFAACDGFTKPGGSVDGMGSQSRLPTAQEFGAPLLADMTACNDALVSPKLLPQQNLRRVHLLRARAGAYLRNGDLAAAFADLDRAEAAAGQLKDDPLFERSLGTSLRLLRALALDRSGQSDQAVAMVEDAANLRPWSIEIQQVLSYLLLHRPGAAATGTMLFGRHRQLDPQFDQYAARAFAAEGNFTALARLASPLSPIPADSAAQAHGKAVGALLLGDVDRAIVHAYAQAAIDNHEAARRELDLVDAWLERGKSGTTGDAGSATEPTVIKELLNKFIANAELSAKRVRARLALDEHRMTDAEALVHGATFASDAISADLNLKLAAAGLAPAAVGWPEWHSTDEDMQTAQRQALFHEAVRDALLEPETPHTNGIYKRSKPNVGAALVGAALSMGTSLLSRTPKTDGFVDTLRPDGSIQISLHGDTIAQAAIREATLLHAAAATLAAGKSAFVVAERTDYYRMLETRQYGQVISITPAGYQTDIVVRQLAPGKDDPRSIDAKAVIAALGPTYDPDTPR